MPGSDGLEAELLVQVGEGRVPSRRAGTSELTLEPSAADRDATIEQPA